MPCRYYCRWEAVVLVRKLALSSLVVFFRDPYVQGSVGSWVIVLALTAHLMESPYEEHFLNRLDMAALGCTYVSIHRLPSPTLFSHCFMPPTPVFNHKVIPPFPLCLFFHRPPRHGPSSSTASPTAWRLTAPW